MPRTRKHTKKGNLKKSIKGGKVLERKIRSRSGKESKSKSIKKTQGISRKGGKYKDATLIFHKESFPSISKVNQWLRKHGFVAKKIKTTKGSFRAVLNEITKKDKLIPKSHFITKVFPNSGVSLLIFYYDDTS
jgi:hypothetical protein